MKLLLTALALLALTGTGLRAEAVRVLSGEHDDFTRIVLVFKEPIQWNERRTPSGYNVELDRSGLSMDLSRVFDLIPKDRVQGVAFDPARSVLSIESDCQCDLEAFVAGRYTIALDVKSVDTPRVTQSLDVEADRFFPLGRPEFPLRTEAQESDRPQDGAAPVTVDRGQGIAEAASLAPSVHQLERALMSHLDRAVSQGLAVPALDQTGTESGNGVTVGVTPLNLPKNMSHLSASTVLDEVSGSPMTGATEEGGSIICPDPAVLDVASWVGEADPGHVLSGAREGLDFDAEPLRSADDLARTYLWLGFGAEARAVAGEFSDRLEYAQLLISLGEIMDYGHSIDPEILSSFLNCPEPFPLWAVLSNPDPSGVSSDHAAAAESTFKRLPPHLRGALGYHLAQRFLDGGHADSATLVRDSTARAMGRDTMELTYLDATSGLPLRAHVDPERNLEKVMRSGTELSPAALMELIKRRIHRGTVDAELAELAESMAHEYRGFSTGLELQKSAVRAYAATGDFDRALEAFAELDAQREDPAVEDAVLSWVVRAMLSQLNDVELVQFIATSDAGLLDRLHPDAALDTAERLLEIGLNALAEELLDRFTLSQDLRARSLRAMLALEQDEPAMALSMIAGEADPGSLRLRARAMAAVGDHEQASVLYEQSKDSDAAASAAWLSGSPERIGFLGSDLERAFAALSQDGPGSAATADASLRGSQDFVGVIGGNLLQNGDSLAQTRERVEQSRELRALVSALLEP